MSLPKSRFPGVYSRVTAAMDWILGRIVRDGLPCGIGIGE